MNRKTSSKAKARQPSGSDKKHSKHARAVTYQRSDDKKEPADDDRRVLKAPVKKIPNVHSTAARKSGGDNQVIKELVQEKQRNKILQLEVERLRKSLDVCKKTINEKSGEIERKNKLINKLIEDKTRIESTNDIMEEDIDSLLHANLGDDVDLDDIFNLSNSAFPSDLGQLDISNIIQDQTLTLSPTSLSMAVNTEFVVDKEEPMQFPNREGSIEKNVDTEVGDVKSLVERMVDQRQSLLTSSEEERVVHKKVSPIKILRGGNEFRVLGKKRSGNTGNAIAPSKPPKLSEKVVSCFDPPKYLACLQCDKRFPLGGQWALERHMSSAHDGQKNCCKYCDKEFLHESTLAAHIRHHQTTNPWQCGKCGYKLDSLGKFKKHVKSVHGVDGFDTARRLLIRHSP